MTGRNRIYFCFTKVRMDALVLQVGDDDGMTNGMTNGILLSCLSTAWIERDYIDLLDLFPVLLVDHMMEANSIGSSPKEGIPGIKRFDNLVGC